MKKRIRGITFACIFICCLMLYTACSNDGITPNQIFASAIDAEMIIYDRASGDEYRITLYRSSEDEKGDCTGEIIYLSPSALSGIHVLSDEMGKRISMNDVEVTVEESELFLPFFLFSTGEIIKKEIGTEEMIYHYADGRNVYFGVKEERLTKITYRGVECTVEWIEVRREKGK